MMAAWRGGHDAGKHDGHVKEHFSKQHFGTHYGDLPLNTMPFQLRDASKAMEIFSAQAPFRIWVKGLSQVFLYTSNNTNWEVTTTITPFFPLGLLQLFPL